MFNRLARLFALIAATLATMFALQGAGCGGGGGGVVVGPLVLNSLSPSSAAIGSPDFILTVNGANFLHGAIVLWDGQPRPTSEISGGQLQAQISSTDLTAQAAVAVTVRNPGGEESNALTFIVGDPNPLPQITSIAPDNTTAGSGAVTVVITGTGFVAGSQVRWNGNALAGASIDSATQITVLVPSSLVQTAGTAQVTVFNPPPEGGSSNAVTFTINP